MHVFIVSYSFPPEDSIYSPDVAEELIKRGHKITVFAPFPNRPQGRLYDGYRRQWRRVSFEKGWRIIRSWHTLSKRSTMISRFMENITFGLTSSFQLLWQLIREPKPDVVFMKTWALFAQGLNSFILKLWNIPIVCGALDIYPESLIDKGVLKSDGIIAKTMRGLNRSHLKRCRQIFTPSPGMVDFLFRTRRLPKDKVKYIPHYEDVSSFLKPFEIGAFRKRYNISEDIFMAMFAGSLTLSAGLRIYIEVAELLKDQEDIKLLLVGDGSYRVELEHQITAHKLTNIQVIYPLKHSEVHEVQSAADLMLLSLKGNMSKSGVPSKQVAYMLSGKPSIANVMTDSYPAQVVIESESGFVLPPEDPASVASLLKEIKDKPDILRQMGENAKRYALKHFSRESVLPRLIEIIESAAN